MPPTTDRFLKIPELLSILCVSRATFYRMLDRGKFPAGHKIANGSARRWLESDLETWLASFRTNSASNATVPGAAS